MCTSAVISPVCMRNDPTQALPGTVVAVAELLICIWFLQLHSVDQRVLRQWLSKADDIVTFMLHSTYRSDAASSLAIECMHV